MSGNDRNDYNEGNSGGRGIMATIMLVAGGLALLLCVLDGSSYYSSSPEERAAKKDFWNTAFNTETGERMERERGQGRGYNRSNGYDDYNRYPSIAEEQRYESSRRNQYSYDQ